jgi:glycosyltransferase involved in cell wall biosynthesis
MSAAPATRAATSPAASAGSGRASTVTAVVPARNAAALLPECLLSITDSGVDDVVVVDGMSTDATVDVAQRFGAQIISDEGAGLPAARALGARAARHDVVVLADADVIWPSGSMAALVEEFERDGFDALQAGLDSVGGPEYWGRALAHHHRTGRSRRWFGLVATVIRRDVLLAAGVDGRFRSGEDIDLRWRLRDAGRRIGVSERTSVVHRFAGDDFAFAKDQFLMDGTGLGRMIRTRKWRGAPLAALPAAAAARGAALSVAHGEPRWVKYYGAFAAWNYVGMARGLRDDAPG